MSSSISKLWDASKTVAPMEIGSIVGGGIGGVLTAGNPLGMLGGAAIGTGVGGLVAHGNLERASQLRYARLQRRVSKGLPLTREQQTFVDSMSDKMTKGAAYHVGQLLAASDAGLL